MLLPKELALLFSVLLLAQNAVFGDQENPRVLLEEMVSEAMIVGGGDAPVNMYPWFAQASWSDNEGLSIVCGGTLVSREFVLTAAHCLPGSNPLMGGWNVGA